MHPTKTLMCLCTLKSRCKNMASHLKGHAPCDLCTHHGLMIYIWLNSHDLAHFLHWVNVYVWRHSQKCRARPHLGALFWEHLPPWGIALHIYSAEFNKHKELTYERYREIRIYIYISEQMEKNLLQKKRKNKSMGEHHPPQTQNQHMTNRSNNKFK
jgi:hypothetical protein